MAASLAPSPSVMETMYETHYCNGTALSLKGGGTWRGHFIPGMIFLGWGFWWTFHIFRLHLLHRLSGDSFVSQAWYAGLWWGLWAIEPALKLFGTPLGILVELRLDHPYFLNLLCREDGTFAMKHIHNWQHASSYPGFIVSGLVDFIGALVPLPAGTQQVFLAMAFFIEGFLMLMHQKHEALDAVIHWLLGCTMWAAAAFVALELHWANTSFLASVGRAFSCIMQGIWLMQIGHILFTGSIAWQPGPGAQMMVPIVFAMLCLALAVALLAAYLTMQWWYQRQACYAALPLTAPEPLQLVEMSPEPLGMSFGGDDSANEQSDGSEGHITPPQKPASSGRAKQQLLLALSSLRSGEHKQPRKRDEHII